jgi:hypothetical protein
MRFKNDYLIILLNFFILLPGIGKAQNQLSENIVVITLDGFRWREVFTGADSLLTFDPNASYNRSYIQENFWAPSAFERRKKLMPFLWTEFAANGILLGNRNYGNNVDNANPYKFSYPGYNEIFTGYPDTLVNSNNKIPNPNENVFEFLDKLKQYKGKTAVFGSWDVFGSIFNEERSGFLVNDGFRDVPGELKGKQELFNQLQHDMPDLFHGSERLDVATFNIAFEYMKINKPRLMHFGFGDTDEFAHEGQYDYYLDAANHADEWIKQIWNYIQSSRQYKNRTTLIVTTDHGRGIATGGKWRDHGSEVPNAGEIWMAILGPSVYPVGECRTNAQFYQGQIAATIAAFLGNEFKTNHPVLPPLVLPVK